MFSKALIATDLSLASHQVVCSAASLKKLGMKEAVLLYCFNDTFGDETGLAFKLLESARPLFNSQKKLLAEKGFIVTGIMTVCSTYLAINRQADDNNCSIIIAGSAGKRMSKFGGVVNSIIHNATKPVLVLRLKFDEKGGEKFCQDCTFDPLEHILFPTDFSENSEHAFAYIQKLSDCGANQITLMHVQNKTRMDDFPEPQLQEHKRMDSERLERLKTDLEKKGAKNVNISLPYGLPKQEIIEYTQKNAISLIVMGSQGRGFIKELFLGSVSHSVVRNAEASVLLIPPVQ
ncbi:MAG: universal stress protein [Sedimentisphaerales bacterium]|nr:universal stress protein [Sedimentisphaerales bacterium]